MDLPKRDVNRVHLSSQVTTRYSSTLYKSAKCKIMCLYFPLLTEIGSFKKRWLKQQDSNLEYFSYESDILPLQPAYNKVLNIQN